MTALWTDIVQTSLLGTARKPLAAPPAQSPEPAAGLTSQLDSSDPERQLLSAISICSTARRAGPPGLTPRPAPEPSAADARPHFNKRCDSILQRLLSDFPVLLPEFYKVCRAAGFCIPPARLVDVLTHAAATQSVQASLLPLLGPRSTWLARLQPDWSFASASTIAASAATDGIDESVWQTGSKEERLQFFSRLRAMNPARSRQLAESTWKQEAAEFREELIGCFAAGLSADDEPFLEAALDDRRKDVRTGARELLALLPASKHAQRQLDLAAASIRIHIKSRGLIGRLTGADAPVTIEVELPPECSKAMERDGIAPKVPAGQKIGERAWWLQQTLMLIHPANLAVRLGVSADQLFEAVKTSSEWAEGIFEAWRTSVKRNSDPEWAFRLYESNRDRFADLLPLLNNAQRDKLILESFRNAKPVDAAHLLQQALAGSGTMSVPVAKSVLAFLKNLAGIQPGNRIYPHYLPWVPLALAMPAELLEEAAAGWPVNVPAWEHWRDHVDKMLQPLQVRAEFHRELKNANEVKGN